MTDHRYVARLADCGTEGCPCLEVKMEEVWIDEHETEHRLPYDINGTFCMEPSSWELEAMQEELAELARRHGMEADGNQSDLYERLL